MLQDNVYITVHFSIIETAVNSTENLYTPNSNFLWPFLPGLYKHQCYKDKATDGCPRDNDLGLLTLPNSCCMIFSEHNIFTTFDHFNSACVTELCKVWRFSPLYLSAIKWLDQIHVPSETISTKFELFDFLLLRYNCVWNME